MSLGEKFLNNTNLSKLTKQEIIEKISNFYSDDEFHAYRLKTYMEKQWFWPSTPVTANIPINGEPYKGSPIACFLSEIDPENLTNKLYETSSISKSGGGLGSKWNGFTSYDQYELSRNGYSVLSYVKQQGEIMRLMSGYARQSGSVASWININHADIVDFINMRKNHQGIDPSLHVPRFIHHGIVITDEFMDCVTHNKPFDLVNSHGNIIKTVNARSLWINIINTRIETGEPYLMFESNANRDLKDYHKKMNLSIKLSNLCTEILLPTGKDQFNQERTAICCLSSINLEKYYEWNSDLLFIEDVLRFQDNIVTYFIVESGEKNVGDIINYEQTYGLMKILGKKEQSAVEKAILHNHPLKNAIYSAWRSRDVGIGACGWSSLLQSLNIPFASQTAAQLNEEIFNLIKIRMDKASEILAEEKGSCPDAALFGVKERCSYKTAIAPTAMLSSILGVSKCIEPDHAIYLSKTQAGSNLIKNKHLTEYLNTMGLNNDDTWHKIAEYGTDILPDNIKEVFRGPFDIKQSVLIEQNARRKIDQGQSFNMFYKKNTNINEILKDHKLLFTSGVKTCYYVYTEAQIESYQGIKLDSSLAGNESKKIINLDINVANLNTINDNVCVSCQ